MSTEKMAQSWVVYLMPSREKPKLSNPTSLTAVCQQSEWDAIELRSPGLNQLVRQGITTETEAEKLARGTSGNPPPRQKTR